MTLLGLDFDNTIVQYDSLFYKLGLEKGLIDESVDPLKNKIRDFLRGKGQEEEFTYLQGEVYGSRILEAEPSPGMKDALMEIRENGTKLVIVSHKTKVPYKGPKYDLRGMAIKWLEKHKFFDEKELGMDRNSVYFEETKQEKIRRIEELGCDIYIDDLCEILEGLKSEITKVHYTNSRQQQSPDTIIMTKWKDLKNALQQN